MKVKPAPVEETKREAGKCQNRKVSESIFSPNWEVPELESFRIGKCQHRKMSEIGKYQN